MALLPDALIPQALTVLAGGSAGRRRVHAHCGQPGRGLRVISGDKLTSDDVIHAFWVPEFLFKRDVIPGHPNHFAITATQTGTFTGHRSEL